MLFHHRSSTVVTLWLAAIAALLLVAEPSIAEMHAMLEGVEKLNVKKCGSETTPISMALDMADGGTWTARDNEGDTYTGTWTSAGKNKYQLQMDSSSFAFLTDELEVDATDLCYTPVTATSATLQKFDLKINGKGDQAKVKMKYRFTGISRYGTGKANYKVSLKGDVVGGGSPAEPDSYLLTIQKAGMGAGTVTGPAGISCGSACDATFEEGEYVTLTASAAGGSGFAGWSGCDSTASNQCTVLMDDDRVVRASFGISSGGIEITELPASDTDGSYTLKWRCTGLCANAYVIEEDDNRNFTSPVTYACNASTQGVNGCELSPTPSFQFTGKADGTWCYRVGMSGAPGQSQTECVAVTRPTRPTGGVLRVANASSYAVVQAELNGTQHFGYMEGILVGQHLDFSFSSPGRVAYNFGIGTWDPITHTANVLYWSYGNVYVAAGSTATVTVSNPTIGQLLTGFRDSADWYGPYWMGTLPYYGRFHFRSDGSWTLYDSTSPCIHWSQCNWTQIDSGVARLVSWPPNAVIVNFQLKPGGESIQLPVGLGGATMMIRNGPPNWPLIEYTMQ